MPEPSFKLALGLLLLLMGIGRQLYGWHWYRAKRKRRRRESGLWFLTLVFVPGILCLLFYLFSSRLDAFHLPLPDWLRLAGAVIFLAGDVLFVLTHRALGRNWSPALEIMEGHTLVTTGPYRYLRHPLYAAALIIALGLSLTAANWLLAVTWTGATVLLVLSRLGVEEAMLLEEFGDAYREYMQRTGRLVPRVKR
jgi:protein-S-isoprenylcysteine O-methyltransferase Ste14